MLRIIAKKDVTCRNYPLNLELMDWIYDALGFSEIEKGLSDDAGKSAKYELRAALTVGFLYALRVSEIENLRIGDIRISHEEGNSLLTVYKKGMAPTNKPMVVFNA